MAQPEIARAIVDLDGSQAGAELKKLEARAKELRAELSKLGKENDLGGFRQKEKELKLVNSQMRNVKKSAWDIEQVLKKLNGSSLNELTRAQRQLTAEIKASSKHTKEELELYNQKVAKLRQVNAAISKVKEESGLAMKAQQSWLSNAAQGFNKYFAIISAGIATFTGVIFSIKSLVQGNMELDDSLADVMKTTGLTKKEVRELYTEFKNLNTRTPRKELLGLAEEAGRLGIEGKKNIMDFVEVANQLKVALGDDLAGNAEEAIREVGKLTEIYRVGQKYGVDFKQSMLMVGSAINEVSANSSANAPFLIDMTKRLAGVSSQAGISVQDIIGYASALDQMGQTSEVSSTTMNKVIVNMFKDVETYAGLAQMGMEDFNILLKTDTNEALLAVLKGLNGNNEGLSVMATKLDGLGLDGSRSVQILAALASNVDLVRKSQDMANTSLEKGTSLTEEYQVKNNNMAGSMDKIGRAIRGAFINSGINEVMSKLITNIAKWVEIPVSRTMEEQRIKVNMLTIELTNANTQEERRKKIYEELKALQPEILEGINQESINIDLLRQNLERYNEEAIRKIALQRASEELTKVQEELGKKISQRARAEADLTKELISLRDKSAKYDEERASSINDILVSDLDILDKEKQINEVVQEINKNQRLNVITGTNAYNLAYGIVGLRNDENKLLEKSNLELSKYQDMYKSIMGGDPNKGAGAAPDAPPVPVDPDAPTTPGSAGASSLLSKLLDQQAAFRMRVINESKSLIEQEQIAYQERLKNAGIYRKAKENLTEEELQVMEILEVQHQENIKKINDQAFSDDIIDQQKNFDQETVRRQTQHNKKIAALGNNIDAIKELNRRFEQEEIQRQTEFLSSLLLELQATVDGETLSGLDDKLLSEEQKEVLKLRIEEVRLKLSELGVQLSALQNPTPEGGASTSLGAKQSGVDIFGMSMEDWSLLIKNMVEGNITLEDTLDIVGSIANAWGDYYDIRNNLDQQDLMNFEASTNRKKQLLESQLNKGIISQDQYHASVEKLDEDLDKKKRELAIKQAKREKSIALMSAIVNTAAAIVSALKTQPVWLGIVMAALVGVMGGLQIAKIATTPIPQYYSGKYDVIGQQDNKKYRAPVIDSPGTGLVNSPAILVGEKPEIIIDPYTTRNLQMNYPEVINAIMAARMPQYASGQYSGTGMKETIKERELPKEFYQIMAGQAEQLRRLNDRLDKGIGARLVADGEYIETHNKVAEDYEDLRNHVSLRS